MNTDPLVMSQRQSLFLPIRSTESSIYNSWDDGFHALMAVATVGVVLISCCAYLFSKLTMSLTQAMPILCLLLILAAVAAQYRWRGEHKCFNLIMMAFWVILLTNLHFFPMYLAATMPVAMSDAWLAGIDHQLGFSVPALLALLEPYPALGDGLQLVYGSLIPMMVAAIIIPPMLDRMDKAKEFALGCLIAASISMPIFACLQAVGPWDYYGFSPPFESLSGKAGMLASLKMDTTFVIDVANRDGLITFPSFHVILTVLAAAALWSVPRMRILVTVWAGLIVFSTLGTGIHYLIDVLGGLGVATVSIVAARKVVLLLPETIAFRRNAMVRPSEGDCPQGA